MLFDESKIEGEVAIGIDNELYLLSKRHKTIDFVNGEKVSEATLKESKKTILNRKKYSQSIGAEYLHLIAPDKHVVLEEKFPIRIKNKLGDALVRYLGLDFILHPVFELKDLDVSPYRKTDSHWSVHGNIEISCLIADKFNFDRKTISNARLEMNKCITGVIEGYSGDLGSKLTPKMLENLAVFKPTWGIESYSNSVDGNDGLVYLIKSNNQNSKGRLVVFGDSFIIQSLNALSYFFSEILCCRSRNYHEEIVSMAKPDYVLTENIERYLSDKIEDLNVPPFFIMPFCKEKKVMYEKDVAVALTDFFNMRK